MRACVVAFVQARKQANRFSISTFLVPSFFFFFALVRPNPKRTQHTNEPRVEESIYPQRIMAYVWNCHIGLEKQKTKHNPHLPKPHESLES